MTVIDLHLRFNYLSECLFYSFKSSPARSKSDQNEEESEKKKRSPPKTEVILLSQKDFEEKEVSRFFIFLYAVKFLFCIYVEKYYEHQFILHDWNIIKTLIYHADFSLNLLLRLENISIRYNKIMLYTSFEL